MCPGNSTRLVRRVALVERSGAKIIRREWIQNDVRLANKNFCVKTVGVLAAERKTPLASARFSAQVPIGLLRCGKPGGGLLCVFAPLAKPAPLSFFRLKRCYKSAPLALGSRRDSRVESHRPRRVARKRYIGGGISKIWILRVVYTVR